MLYLSTAMPLYGSYFNIYISVILKAQPRKKMEYMVTVKYRLYVRASGKTEGKSEVQRDVDG